MSDQLRTILAMESSKSHRFKVGFYTPFFLPVIGGTQSATLNLARELSPYCDVEVHTLNSTVTTVRGRQHGLDLTNGLPERETVDGVQVYRYSFTNLPIVMDFSPKLIENISLSNIDILHFQGLHRPFNRLLLQKANRGKIRVLTTHALQESIETVMRSKGGHLIRSLFLAPLKGMNQIIALTHSDEKSLTNLGLSPDKIAVIPNGIDTRKFSNRKKFVEDNERLKILCVGRFDKNKNYESLIHTVERLRNHGTDLEAYFIGGIGDHAYFKEISELIHKKGLESRIRMGVSLEDPYLVDCYLSCDLFVLPSRSETLPLAILEAMYAGLPIVATRVGGIPEVVIEDKNGFLVPPNEPESLYERCLKLLESEKLRKSFGTFSTKIAANYSWPKIAALTFKIYERLFHDGHSD